MTTFTAKFSGTPRARFSNTMKSLVMTWKLKQLFMLCLPILQHFKRQCSGSNLSNHSETKTNAHQGTQSHKNFAKIRHLISVIKLLNWVVSFYLWYQVLSISVAYDKNYLQFTKQINKFHAILRPGRKFFNLKTILSTLYSL